MKPVAQIALLLALLPLVQAQFLSHELLGAGPHTRLGSSLLGVGDHDLDGVPDLLCGGQGRVELRSGRDGSLIHGWDGPGLADDLGASLAVVGDVDQDGIVDFAFGAPELPSSGPGRVEIVSGFHFQTLQTLVGSLGGDRFGQALAGPGDLDADGYPELVVGLPGSSSSGFLTGRVEIWSLAPTPMLLATQVGALPNDDFGASLALPGDLDGDGNPELLVGAPGANPLPFPPGTGVVHLFSGVTGPMLESFLGSSPGARFGASLAVGDFDLDGIQDLVAGAPGIGTLPGQVVVIRGMAPRLPLATLSGQAGESFGQAVAVVGDQNGDGFPDLLIGAPGSPFGNVGVFDAFSSTRLLDFPGSQALSGWGGQVAAGPDLDADGRPELMMSSPGHPGPATPRGRVAIFMANPALSPLAAGAAAAEFLIDGADGGSLRRVDRGIAQPFSFSLAAAPGAPALGAFALFGMLGVPPWTFRLSLPFGLGDAVVPPCPALPTWNGILFTVAASQPLGACVPLVPNASLPWLATDSDGLGVAATFTFQAVCADINGSLSLSNAVSLRVR
ncbi:MAG: FG-GAP repeat protein [Planctomycetes bacterium]|nr:FG-GAP repeat protein [Planctomycetota bacterium]